MGKQSRLKLLGVAVAGLGTVMTAQAMAGTPSTSAVRVVGLLQTDYANFSGDTSVGFDSSGQVRRADIAFKGKLNSDWSYQIAVDLKKLAKSDKNSLKQSWLGYSGFENLFIAVGRVAIPHGLENWGSSSATTFMERASVSDAFAPQDGPGLYAEGHTHNMFTYALGITTPDVGTKFDGSSSSSSGSISYGDDEISYGGRLTFSPVHEQDQTLHFGASYWGQRIDRREMWSDYHGFRARPELQGRYTPYVINTVERGTGTVDRVGIWGLEAAGVWNQFSAQGEYQRADVYGRSGTANLDLHGWYAQVGYMITGELRPYHFESGTFGNVVPKCEPLGAWEVAVRYSDLDLSDRDSSDTLPPVARLGENSLPQPGELKDWTVGLNWYATQNVKFQLNYVRSKTEYSSTVKSNTTDVDESNSGVAPSDRTLNIWGLRAQVRF